MQDNSYAHNTQQANQISQLPSNRLVFTDGQSITEVSNRHYFHFWQMPENALLKATK